MPKEFHHYSSVRNKVGPHTGLPQIPRGLKPPNTGREQAIDLASPWKISAIEEGLGGRYGREAIIDMLRQCRGDIDTAFCNLLDEEAPLSPAKPPPPETVASKTPVKSFLQSSPSRSSSPFSTASKRSAEASDPEDAPTTSRVVQRGRDQKKRILPNVTVGIAFRNYQNDLVSLRLRLGPGSNKPTPSSGATSGGDAEFQDQSDDGDELDPAEEGDDDRDDETWSPDNENSDDHSTTPRRSRRSTKGQHRGYIE